MAIIVGIALAAISVGFLGYSSLCIKHAARFRYLSIRTVYVSLGFVAIAVISLMLLVASYIWYRMV